MIHLVTGGARAGKSTYALVEAEATDADVLAFVATAEAHDSEMAERIQRHRAERSPRWVTYEEPIALDTVLPKVRAGAVVVDCLTLWVSNLLFAGGDDAWIEAHFDRLVTTLRGMHVPVWVVTNEVGLGIVPADPLTRRYRDLLGRCNQRVAAAADRATLVLSGLPLAIKG